MDIKPKGALLLTNPDGTVKSMPFNDQNTYPKSSQVYASSDVQGCSTENIRSWDGPPKTLSDVKSDLLVRPSSISLHYLHAWSGGRALRACSGSCERQYPFRLYREAATRWRRNCSARAVLAGKRLSADSSASSRRTSSFASARRARCRHRRTPSRNPPRPRCASHPRPVSRPQSATLMRPARVS